MPTPMPPRPPLQDFWVLVHVRLYEPLPVDEGMSGVQAIGYFQNIGFRCEPARCAAFLATRFDDGEVCWEAGDLEPIEIADIANPDILAGVLHVDGEGIWYRSGRSFY